MYIDEVYISAYLRLVGEKSVHATFAFGCKRFKLRTSDPKCFGMRGWGDKYVIERDVVIKNFLEDDGSLVIECDIQIAAENKRIWYPKELW